MTNPPLEWTDPVVERLREARHELTVALQPRRSEVERTVCINQALGKIDAALQSSVVTEGMIEAGRLAAHQRHVAHGFSVMGSDDLTAIYTAMSSASAPDSGALREALTEARKFINERGLKDSDYGMATDTCNILAKIDAALTTPTDGDDSGLG